MYRLKEDEQANRRARRRERRAKLDEIKVERGCVDCGFKAHPSALHFDHRDRTLKRFSIAHGIMSGWTKLLEEVAKCDVRCANCHAIKTTEHRDRRKADVCEALCGSVAVQDVARL